MLIASRTLKGLFRRTSVAAPKNSDNPGSKGLRGPFSVSKCLSVCLSVPFCHLTERRVLRHVFP